MKTFKKVTAIVLSVSMLSSVALMTGCSKGKGSSKKVDGDTPWFNSTTAEIGTQYAEDSDIEYYYTQVRGVYGDGVIVTTDGSYKMPDDFDWERDDYTDYSIQNLEYYTLDGELISSIDLYDCYDWDNQYLEDVVISSDSVQIKICDYSGIKETHYIADVDIDAGTVGDLVEIEQAASGFNPGEDMWSEGTWSINGYVIERFWMNSSNNNSYTFTISSPDGDFTVVDLSTEIPQANIFDISSYITISDEEIILLASSEDISFIGLNIVTGEVNANTSDEYEWLEDLDYYRFQSINGNTYYADTQGVKRVDFENNEVVDALSFNDCNINRYSLTDLELVSADDDRYVFAGSVWKYDSLSFNYSSNDTPMIVTLEKADSNPNEGKTLINACVVGDSYYDYAMCESINRFNETSEDYFIALDTRYGIDEYFDYNDVGEDDDYMASYFSGQAQLSSQLAIDMMAGDGPDVILNASAFGQILSEDYLLDLSDYMRDLDMNDYFENIISASEIEGKHLYMPIDFTLNGIVTDDTNVSGDQVGFTFDQYVEFVDEVCNGSDPMMSENLEALATIYASMSDLCVDGRTVSFDNEAFRALAEYCKEDINYIAPNYDEWDWYEDYNSQPAQVATFGSIGNALSNNYLNHKALLGLPSFDGRGPAITFGTSVGISANCSSDTADGAWEFIKFLLSDEIQDLFVRNGNNPVLLSTFDSTAAEAIENYNSSLNGDNYSISGWYNATDPVDEDAADTYKAALLAASSVINVDPAIMAVIREEMPAYFEGHKKLDDVLDILQDRVQTIVNERG